MKKMDKVMKNVDQKVNQKIRPIWSWVQKYFPIFSATLLSLLVLFFVLRVFHNKPYFATAVIASDIKSIVSALDKIDNDCSILKIENNRNYVDFLTVEDFAGSEVGCLNLAYPKKWKGPYLRDNPTMQGKLYEIIKTKDGIFVVPGKDVKLPNGFIVGKDFQITYNSPIFEMIEKNGKLNYNGMALVAQLKFTIGDWEREKITPHEVEEINSALEEFNAAMPFTYNQTRPVEY